jgi:hypothetical protein
MEHRTRTSPEPVHPWLRAARDFVILSALWSVGVSMPLILAAQCFVRWP